MSRFCTAFFATPPLQAVLLLWPKKENQSPKAELTLELSARKLRFSSLRTVTGVALY